MSADDIFEAVKTGDLSLVRAYLTKFSDDSADPNVEDIVAAAARASHVDVVTWLIDRRFPTFKPYLHSHLAALQGGTSVYDVFVAKWPYLLNTELGHNGNPIGWSIFGNNKPMVEYILAKGVDPNNAQFAHRTVGPITSACRNRRSCENAKWSDMLQYKDNLEMLDDVNKDIITLMMDHGFHMPATDGRKDARCAVN